MILNEVAALYPLPIHCQFPQIFLKYRTGPYNTGRSVTLVGRFVEIKLNRYQSVKENFVSLLVSGRRSRFIYFFFNETVASGSAVSETVYIL